MMSGIFCSISHYVIIKHKTNCMFKQTRTTAIGVISYFDTDINRYATPKIGLGGKAFILRGIDLNKRIKIKPPSIAPDLCCIYNFKLLLIFKCHVTRSP